MATALGPLLQLMRNGTIPPAEADEILYYLQVTAGGKNFLVAKAQRLTRDATPSDD